MRAFIAAALASTSLATVATGAAWAQQAQQPQQQQQQQRSTQSASAPANQPNQATASELRGKQVVNADGRQVGRVQRILVSDDGQSFAVIRFNDSAGVDGEPRLAPLSHLSRRGDRLSLTGDQSEWQRLEAYQQGGQGFRRADGQRELTLSGEQRQPSASRIIVQQPSLRVEQGVPRVTVQQARPRVTVSQGQPEIVVHQPQPTVRVDIPQPRITVRMPEPDVNVATAPPQVDVRQSQSGVQMSQSGQEAQVQVERRGSGQGDGQRAQPRVNLQWAEGQPQVRYESAQPRVVVNQPQGQPEVRIERMQAGQQGQAQQQRMEGQQARASTDQSAQQAATSGQQREASQQREANRQQQANRMTDEERANARTRLGVGDSQTAASSARRNVPVRALTIDAFNDMKVFNARGDELGEVDSVVTDGYGRYYVVIDEGGFLGIGDDEVAFPIERFWVKGDALVIRDVTEGDLDAMDDYRSAAETYREVADNAVAELRVWQ